MIPEALRKKRDPQGGHPGGHRSNPTPNFRLENTIMTQPIDSRLDDVVKLIDEARNITNQFIRELPEDVPMFALVDIVNALWNLRNAAVLLDKANDTLEAAGVTR